tara:strand:+ start:699 stop:1535 length:837 start_codon:yes stop_codon:yes gene_type:complete
MELHYKVFILIISVAMTSCSSLPNLPKFDFDNSVSNNVLDESFDGYDDELGGFEIEDGAKDFAKCATTTECNLLWDVAKEWLTEKSDYRGDLKTNTNNFLKTTSFPNKKKADKISFEVTKIPSGKKNIIQIEAVCPKNCSNFIDREFYAFNNFLRSHLIAFKKGDISYAKNEDSSISSSTASSESKIDIDVSDLTEKPQNSILEKDLLSDKIEITKTNKKRYIGKVAESLIDEHSCHKLSEINLVKKTKNRELYEVNCIIKVKRMIYDCGPNGCEVLQ